MPRTHQTLADVLGVLHQQGTRHVTLEVLEDKVTLLEDFEQGGLDFPCVGFNNGVVWFYDKDRRPLVENGKGIMKSKAPAGSRGLLGDLEAEGSLVLVEGERDYLTGLSLHLNAICCGGTCNLSEAAKQALAAQAKKTVIVLFDNDEPGRDAAGNLAAELKLLNISCVKVARVPDEGADLSDWAEQFDDLAAAAGAAMTLISQADTVKTKDAKAHLKLKQKEEEDYKRETDEKRLEDGSLLTPVWIPDDPTQPHALYKGKTRLLFCDAAKTARSGFPVIQILDEFIEGGVQGDLYHDEDPHANKPAVLRPLNNDVFPKRILITPSNAVEHGSTEQLFDDLVAFFDRYFVVQPAFLRAMAAYTLLTYRYQDANLETLPYLVVIGKAGQGKTRFGRVMFEVCFRSLFVTAMRPVHLYRIVECFEGGGVTMVFEELRVGDRSDDGMEFQRMLNAGNQRGVWVPRMGGRQFSQIDWMRLFCPKVLGMDGHFSDEGMTRRCITARLGEMPIPTEKCFEVLPLEFYQEGAELRNRLLGWRCSKLEWATPAMDPKLRDEAIEIGIWQNYFPVVAMIPKGREEATEQILSLAHHSQTVLTQVREAAPEIQVLEALIQVIEERNGREFALLEKALAALNEMDRHARWDTQRLTSSIRTLNLAPRRTKITDEGISRNVRMVDIDDAFQQCVDRHKLELDAARRQQREKAEEVM